MDFNTPALQDHYISVLERLRNWIALLAGWLEDATPQNTPVGTKRWSEANQRFERFDGAVWQPLAQQYRINVDQVGGRDAGNGEGNLAVNNGALNRNLNAEKLGGQDTAYYASQADTQARVAKAGDTMSGPLTLAGHASEPLQAVSKQQLDAALQSAIPADGSVTGPKIAPGAVTSDKVSGPLKAPSFAVDNGIDGMDTGNGDGASGTVNNLALRSWQGIGLGPSIEGQPVPRGEYSHWFNTRTGDAGFRGTLEVGVAGRFHSGWVHLSSANGDGATRYLHHNDGAMGFVGNDGAWKLRVWDSGDVQAEGAMSAGYWLRLRNPGDGTTRALHHNDGSIGFVGHEGGWKLRVWEDGNVWSPMFGYLNEAFAPRSALSLHGIGSISTGLAYQGQTGQVRAMPDLPGAWLLLTARGLVNNHWLCVRVQ